MYAFNQPPTIPTCKTFVPQLIITVFPLFHTNDSTFPLLTQEKNKPSSLQASDTTIVRYRCPTLITNTRSLSQASNR